MTKKRKRSINFMEFFMKSRVFFVISYLVVQYWIEFSKLKKNGKNFLQNHIHYNVFLNEPIKKHLNWTNQFFAVSQLTLFFLQGRGHTGQKLRILSLKRQYRNTNFSSFFWNVMVHKTKVGWYVENLTDAVHFCPFFSMYLKNLFWCDHKLNRPKIIKFAV
jgi:hypothetical protein